MDLSPVKLEILQELLLFDKPVKALHVAKEIGKNPPPVQMHLIDLVKKGYAQSPEKGAYVISEKGKTAVGLSEVTGEQAKNILRQVPEEKAFHFYLELEKPTEIRVKSLAEFCKELPQVPVESVEFHVDRGDFGAWFRSLGDAELPKIVALIKERKIGGEELKSRLLALARSRYAELSKVC